MRPILRSACLLALLLASGSAAALGLGQIQVRSGPGEPLLADIPVISNDPAELAQLQAALASPETFTRIGLEPPVGVVAGLQFAVTRDARGRPIIRVTSSQPVTEPLLTFLVEVDWGQGRLVREYSASLGQPGSVEAAPAAPVQAPVVEAPPVIERPAPDAATPGPRAPAPAPAPAGRDPVDAPPSTEASAYRVRSGDTLSRIADRVAPRGVTAEQAMIGLLRANPGAFIGGDINQLRRGSVLQVPPAAELDAIAAREAANLVRSYTRQWRQARSQPAAQASAARAPAPAPRAAPVAVPDARLEIVPPGDSTRARAGTQSGIAGQGEGAMLRQELQQTRETLAARDAELQELKSRVAELERLQADQQKLIAMKDADMAGAQQRLAATAPKNDAASPLPWIAAVALVLLGLLAAAWNRRRARAEPLFRAPAEGDRPSVAAHFAATPPQGPAPDAAAMPSWERAADRPVRATADVPAPDAAAIADATQQDIGSVERLELAQAYMDSGDSESARRLLREVVETGDATTRGVAARMLQALE